ncbi:Imm27 family immunity protein [Flagellimonas sp. S3867]|uniref:Imm27 family immunity protein n=1 Tax=Flagellimonas sp. S3867 TaxID=2768063 RepID=UPI001CC26507|nr:Imm27 family immunity protein [Flagellimonas sp. S3867]
MKYKVFSVVQFSDSLVKSKRLEKIATDSVNWWTFYKNKEANWIEFYPFSEHHGGGAPYIINIGSSDFEPWIEDNKDFVNSVRELIDTKV